jgi:hypothetical protein
VFQKVKFPKLTYYDFNDVKTHLPDSGIPIEMLRELQNNLKNSDVKISIKALEKDLKKTGKLPNG